MYQELIKNTPALINHSIKCLRILCVSLILAVFVWINLFPKCQCPPSSAIKTPLDHFFQQNRCFTRYEMNFVKPELSDLLSREFDSVSFMFLLSKLPWSKITNFN